MKKISPLSELKIRGTKPGKKIKKLFDGGGLYLEISPSGVKGWRWKYCFDGKEKLLSMGPYPEVSMKEARNQREAARALLANGVDPSENRKAQKSARVELTANCFETLAREWFSRNTENMAAGHRKRIISRLEKDVFPWLGARPVVEILPTELLSILRRIEGRGAVESARRALGDISRIFRYAVVTGRMLSDPSRDLRGALPPKKEEHFAAITEPKRVGELLRVLEGYHGQFVVKCALRLNPLVFVRPGELRKAEWKDINLDAAEWRFLVTKTNTAHIVPLSRQAVEILRELQPLTGSGQYVFPGGRTPTRPMSDNAILAAMRRMGIGKEEMTGHGFRAMARSILDEVLGFRVDLIEHQLAHSVRDPLGTAYNRTTFLEKRRKMMQEWADYLDKLKRGDELILLPSRSVNGVPIRDFSDADIEEWEEADKFVPKARKINFSKN